MERLGRFFAGLAQRYLPDPLVLAVLLTLGVMAAAWAIPQSHALAAQTAAARLGAVTSLWFEGVANTGFLAFAAQMCLILLTGFGLAQAPWATRLLESVAAAYVGMMIWHGGLSGSAPLKVVEGIPLEQMVEGRMTTVHTAGLTVNRTIFSPANLGLSLVLFMAVPLLARSMTPRTGSPHLELFLEDESGAPPVRILERPEERGAERSPADALNHARGLRALLVAVALLTFVLHVWKKRWAAVDLTFIILLFLTLGLMVHRDIVSYMAAVAEGGKAITGIVIQFPLYAGIQNLMTGAGLAAAVSHLFVDLSDHLTAWLGIAPAVTFPLATFASASMINLFIPSGGGQWIVQGPIMCSAADQLHLPLNQAVMAVAYGDEFTNMVQPFWAIPLMGLTRVDARRFMGYCALLMLLATPAFVAALLCF